MRLYILTIGLKQKFLVKEKGEIVETDWSKLKSTEDTKLTLITCVENKPDKRFYIIADLKES